MNATKKYLSWLSWDRIKWMFVWQSRENGSQSGALARHPHSKRSRGILASSCKLVKDGRTPAVSGDPSCSLHPLHTHTHGCSTQPLSQFAQSTQRILALSALFTIPRQRQQWSKGCYECHYWFKSLIEKSLISILEWQVILSSNNLSTEPEVPTARRFFFISAVTGAASSAAIKHS